MPHAVASDFGEGDLHATLLANDAAILHTLVLAAQALVILNRAEDSSAEQTIAFRLKRAIVDRLRLLDLSERPGVDSFGTGDRDADLVEALRPADLPKNIHQFVHQRPLCARLSCPRTRASRATGARLADLDPRSRGGDGRETFTRGLNRPVSSSAAPTRR